MIDSRNIKCEISYDGTEFHGFQSQPNHRTVQGEIEKAVSKITKNETNIIYSGRTDAGVHARKQVINFHINNSIPSDKIRKALNSNLPGDIVVLHAEEAPIDFHSRYHVKEKTYRYFLDNHQIPDIFRRRYEWRVPYKLNIEKMNEASHLFIGEHDFTSFSSAKTVKENRVRTIHASDLWVEDGKVIFQITGKGFLYNMVRIIVGTLVDIGRGRMEVKEIEEMFNTKDRGDAGMTAPANGLFLWDVKY